MRPPDEIDEFAERHHPVGGVLKGNSLEFGRREIPHRATCFGQAVEGVIVEDHRLAIGAALQVDLDGVARLKRRCGRRRCVLDHAAFCIMQAQRCAIGRAVSQSGYVI